MASAPLRSPRSLSPLNHGGDGGEEGGGISATDMSSLELVDPSFFISSTQSKYAPEKVLLSLTSQLKAASLYINSSNSAGNSIPELVKAATSSMQCQCSCLIVYKLSVNNSSDGSLASATICTVTCSDITANPDDHFLAAVYSTDTSLLHKIESIEVSTLGECLRSLKNHFQKINKNFVANIPIIDSISSSAIGVVTVTSAQPFSYLDTVILKNLGVGISKLWSRESSPLESLFSSNILSSSEHAIDLKVTSIIINGVYGKINNSQLVDNSIRGGGGGGGGNNNDKSNNNNIDNYNDALIDSIKSSLYQSSFNTLEYTEKNDLVAIVMHIFNSSTVTKDLGSLNVDASDLLGYVKLVAMAYKENPFHNLQHGVSVLQATLLLLTETEANSFLSPLQLFTTMMSAYIHDVAHPGNTNLFEINTRSELSILYNDTSCLENYHLYIAFQLTRTEKSNILKNFNRNQVTEFRKFMTGMVLATDMSVHGVLIDDLKSRSVDGKEKLQTDAAEQLFFCKIMVHSADLMNPARPFELSKKWSSLVSAEFNAQVEKEKSLSLPFMPFMITPDIKTLCKNEIGFASFAVAPLWKGLANWFPKTIEHYNQVISNVDEWKALMAQQP